MDNQNVEFMDRNDENRTRFSHLSGSAAAKDWWTAEWFQTWLKLAHSQ